VFCSLILARGSGYLKDYNEAEVAAALAAEDAGRPIVCVGAEDAAKSVGRHHSQRKNVASVEAAKDDLNDDAEGARQNGTSKVETARCSNPRCNRATKPGCVYAACKRCCMRGWPGTIGTATLPKDADSVPRVCSVHRTKQQNASDAVMKASVPARIVDRKGDELVAPAVVDEIYVCDCKCLLVGIGADEQMAGYGRHKTIFMKALKTAAKSRGDSNSDSASEAVQALEHELSIDLERLWKRNLGRDDRCVSDSGREAWFPFLDEHVVNFLQALPMIEVITGLHSNELLLY
jgi:hypothetical protein